MKLLFTDHTGELGGAELALSRYFESPSRIDRELLLFRDGALADVARTSGIPSKVIDVNVRHPQTYRSMYEVRRYIRAGNFDAIIANSLDSAVIVSLTCGRSVPQIMYLREGLDWLSRRRRLLVSATALRTSIGFLANSRWTASTLGNDLKNRPLAVVYTHSGVETPRTSPNFERPRDARLRILSLSRFVPWKGLHVLLAAARQLDAEGLGERITVTLAGEGVLGDAEYTRMLKSMSRDMGSMVTFMPHTQDVSLLLKQSDVVVHASIEPEPLGQVLIQAMATGVVAVSTGTGGAAELITHGSNGVIVPPGDAPALASALKTLIEQPAYASRMAREGTSVAERFTDAAVSGRLEEAIASMIGKYMCEEGAG